MNDNAVLASSNISVGNLPVHLLKVDSNLRKSGIADELNSMVGILSVDTPYLSVQDGNGVVALLRKWAIELMYAHALHQIEISREAGSGDFDPDNVENKESYWMAVQWGQDISAEHPSVECVISEYFGPAASDDEIYNDSMVIQMVKALMALLSPLRALSGKSDAFYKGWATVRKVRAEGFEEDCRMEADGPEARLFSLMSVNIHTRGDASQIKH